MEHGKQAGCWAGMAAAGVLGRDGSRRDAGPGWQQAGCWAGMAAGGVLGRDGSSRGAGLGWQQPGCWAGMAAAGVLGRDGSRRGAGPGWQQAGCWAGMAAVPVSIEVKLIDSLDGGFSENYGSVTDARFRDRRLHSARVIE
ncbi:hypothetical protein chiPu_0010529 [Chiloscyllium punctatum]|uniref:Uncharacterized protein n=1 Tax=Chiloscyllium punctatum TaxID=137246 RepID=A0A401SNU8_CHIPU|nr:hypothetical protein [Chiloscyllium punctatum]